MVMYELIPEIVEKAWSLINQDFSEAEKNGTEAPAELLQAVI